MIGVAGKRALATKGVGWRLYSPPFRTGRSFRVVPSCGAVISILRRDARVRMIHRDAWHAIQYVRPRNSAGASFRPGKRQVQELPFCGCFPLGPGNVSSSNIPSLPRTDPPLICPSPMLILIYTLLCRHSSASSPLLLHFRAMRSRASAVPLPLVPPSSPAPYMLLNLRFRQHATRPRHRLAQHHLACAHDPRTLPALRGHCASHCARQAR